MWNVTVVQQTPFTCSEPDRESHILQYSRIIFKGASVTNSLNTVNPENMVAGLAAAESTPVRLNVVGDGGPVTILSSRAASGALATNGSISSMVFKNNYKEADYNTVAENDVNDRGKILMLNFRQKQLTEFKEEATMPKSFGHYLLAYRMTRDS